MTKPKPFKWTVRNVYVALRQMIQDERRALDMVTNTIAEDAGELKAKVDAIEKSYAQDSQIASLEHKTEDHDDRLANIARDNCDRSNAIDKLQLQVQAMEARLARAEKNSAADKIAIGELMDCLKHPMRFTDIPSGEGTELGKIKVWKHNADTVFSGIMERLKALERQNSRGVEIVQTYEARAEDLRKEISNRVEKVSLELSARIDLISREFAKRLEDATKPDASGIITVETQEGCLPGEMPYRSSKRKRTIAAMQERRGYCSNELIAIADDGTAWRYTDHKAGESPAHATIPCDPHWAPLPQLPDA